MSTAAETADGYASRLGGHRIVLALALQGRNTRKTAETAAGVSWEADCPAPGCLKPAALSIFTDRAGTTRITCRGNCRDARIPLIYVHAAYASARAYMTELPEPVQVAA